MAETTKYHEGVSYSRIQRLSWKIYRRLPPAMAKYFKGLRLRFSDEEGHDVAWFGLHCVQRREGGGFVSVGDNARIEGSLICHRHDSRIAIGARTSIGGGTVIESLRSVSVGDDCLISHYVTIQDHNSHPLEWEHRSQDVLNWLAGVKDWTHVEQANIIIERRCWIGTRCIILKGVHLGEGCVVGAGSVVTRPFPAYSVVAGNPARLIRTLSVVAQ
jgi:acetyltransferase-like isoleucine patch superfamily enzyme